MRIHMTKDSAKTYWLARARETASSWRQMFAMRSFPGDLVAGLTVAFIALPLNLALAVACGLPPGIGLITAVVAGIVAGLLGGSRLQVSGPAAAMVPLVLEIVTRHGVEGMVVAAFLTGIFQILLGFARVGRFVQTIPTSVITGFMTGIGLLILAGQIPRLFGLPADVKSVSGMVTDVGWTAQVHWIGLALGASVFVGMFVFPRIARWLPAALIGIVVVTVVAAVAKLDVATVGAIPSGLPAPGLPDFSKVNLVSLLPEVFAMTALASAESLLSAVVVDSMSKSPRHSSNQELVGQGVANILSSFFGGMPVTGVIVRSSVAVQTGGKTRLVSVSHAGWLLVMMVAAGALVALVPMAALAGILIFVGFRLLEVREFIKMWKVSRFEAGIFLATAVGIVLTDFIVGVGIGLILALVHFAHTQRELGIELSSPLVDEPAEIEQLLGPRRLEDHPLPEPDVATIRVEGPIYFASHTNLDAILQHRLPHCLIFDLAEVPLIDVTGLETFRTLLEDLKHRGTRVILIRASAEVAKRLTSARVTDLVEGGQVYPSFDAALVHEATAPILAQNGNGKGNGKASGGDRAESDVRPEPAHSASPV